jgi:hypothetical protein
MFVPLKKGHVGCFQHPERSVRRRTQEREDPASGNSSDAPRAPHMEWIDAMTSWYFGDLVEMGELDAARALAQVHARLADTIRQPFMQTMGLASLTLLAANEGRFASRAAGRRDLHDGAALAWSGQQRSP